MHNPKQDTEAPTVLPSEHGEAQTRTAYSGGRAKGGPSEADRRSKKRDRPGQEKAIEAQAEKAGEPDAPYLGAPLYTQRLPTWRRLIKGSVQAIYSTNLLNRIRRRPRYVAVHWPDELNHLNIRRNFYIKSTGQAMPEDLKHESSDCECDPKNATSAGKPGFNLLFRRLVCRVKVSYVLFTRRHQEFAPRVICVDRSVSKPYSVIIGRLFNLVEAMIFRIWYNSLGRMKVLIHKCRFNCPGCNQGLSGRSKLRSLPVTNHRAE